MEGYSGYIGLQKVSRGYPELQRVRGVTRGDKGVKGVTSRYGRLQEITGDKKR